MELSINAMHFCEARKNESERDLKKAIDLVNEAGFKLVDLSAERLDLQSAEEIFEYLKSKGMKANQTHAPFNRYAGVSYDIFASDLMDAIKVTHAAGAKIMVVHGDEFDFKSMTYSKTAAMEFNYKLFYPVVEYAAAHGIKVAFECLFEDNASKPRLCSEIEDLTELVEKYDDKSVGICWDFGHAFVQHKEKHTEKLRLAGKKIISTHVHDNYYEKDLHLFPYLGKIEWEEVMETIREIGYAGDWTYEFVYDRIPEVFLPDYLKLLYKTGKYMINA